MAESDDEAFKAEWARRNRGAIWHAARNGIRLWLAVGGGIVAAALTLGVLLLLHQSRLDARREAFERAERGELVLVERSVPTFSPVNLLIPIVAAAVVAGAMKKALRA